MFDELGELGTVVLVVAPLAAAGLGPEGDPVSAANRNATALARTVHRLAEAGMDDGEIMEAIRETPWRGFPTGERTPEEVARRVLTQRRRLQLGPGPGLLERARQRLRTAREGTG